MPLFLLSLSFSFFLAVVFSASTKWVSNQPVSAPAHQNDRRTEEKAKKSRNGVGKTTDVLWHRGYCLFHGLCFSSLFSLSLSLSLFYPPVPCVFFKCIYLFRCSLLILLRVGQSRTPILTTSPPSCALSAVSFLLAGTVSTSATNVAPAGQSRGRVPAWPILTPISRVLHVFHSPSSPCSDTLQKEKQKKKCSFRRQVCWIRPYPQTRVCAAPRAGHGGRAGGGARRTVMTG